MVYGKGMGKGKSKGAGKSHRFYLRWGGAVAEMVPEHRFVSSRASIKARHGERHELKQGLRRMEHAPDHGLDRS